MVKEIKDPKKRIARLILMQITCKGLARNEEK